MKSNFKKIVVLVAILASAIALSTAAYADDYRDDSSRLIGPGEVYSSVQVTGRILESTEINVMLPLHVHWTSLNGQVFSPEYRIENRGHNRVNVRVMEMAPNNHTNFGLDSQLHLYLHSWDPWGWGASSNHIDLIQWGNYHFDYTTWDNANFLGSINYGETIYYHFGGHFAGGGWWDGFQHTSHDMILRFSIFD